MAFPLPPCSPPVGPSPQPPACSPCLPGPAPSQDHRHPSARTSLSLLHPRKPPAHSCPVSPTHGAPLPCRPPVWWRRSRAELRGSPDPRCVPPQTHRQPQSVLCTTGGSTAPSRRGCPRRMGGWNCMRGGGSGARGMVRGPWSPPPSHGWSGGKFRFQAEVGGPWKR